MILDDLAINETYNLEGLGKAKLTSTQGSVYYFTQSIENNALEELGFLPEQLVSLSNGTIITRGNPGRTNYTRNREVAA